MLYVSSEITLQNVGMTELAEEKDLPSVEDEEEGESREKDKTEDKLNGGDDENGNDESADNSSFAYFAPPIDRFQTTIPNTKSKRCSMRKSEGTTPTTWWGIFSKI